MTDRRLQVGIDRFIRLEWLEYTSNLMLAGNSVKTVEYELEQSLKSSFSSSVPGRRGALSKTLTILMRTWPRADSEIQCLRDSGLKLLQTVKKSDHIAIQWGMIMAAYPFWGSVARQTGRLLRLQENIAANQIQRRLREQYGERETVSRSAQRVIQAFVDWGVLKKAEEVGMYGQVQAYSIDDPRLISWLIEASLHSSSNRAAMIKDLLDSTSLFPFRLMHVPAEHLVTISPRLDLLRHGLDDDLVMLRKQS